MLLIGILRKEMSFKFADHLDGIRTLYPLYPQKN